MSVKVVCQYSNLEFEADTKRTKNHPKISAWLSSAFEEGWRNEALAAIAAGKEAGFTTIAEFVALLQETETAAKAGQAVEYAKRITEFRQAKADAKAQQEAFYTARANGTYKRQEHDDNLPQQDNVSSINRPANEPEW